MIDLFSIIYVINALPMIGLLEFTYVHDLLWEYVQEITDKPSYLNDVIQQLADAAPKLMSTKPGAKVVCVVATYAGAKERKRLVKSLKGKVMESLLHPSAHLAVMRIIDVTDDTVNVQKSLLDEIKSTEPIFKYAANGEVIGKPLPALVSISKHYFGRKLLLRLLNPAKSHLEPDETLLFSTESPTSKKSPDVRRAEHLVYLKSSLLFVATAYVEDLLTCKFGSKVFEEIVWVFRPVNTLKSVVRLLTGDHLDVVVEEGGRNEQVDGLKETNNSDEEQIDETDAPASEDVSINENDDEAVVFEAIEEEEAGEEADTGAANDSEQFSMPIEENPYAQAVLKSLLLLEAYSEDSAVNLKRRDHVDRRMWEESEFSLASHIITALVEKSLLEQWLTHNRTCFALLDCLRVPSASSYIKKVISAHIEVLRSSAHEHKGGSLLLERLEL